MLLCVVAKGKAKQDGNMRGTRLGKKVRNVWLMSKKMIEIIFLT